MYDPFASFKKHTLPNGLDIYFLPVDRPWAIVQFVVHAGAHEDPITLPGLAHFVEHCVSKNIEGHEQREVTDFFRSLGGYANFGVTSYEATKYRFKIPNQEEALVRALSFFGRMLIEARLEKDIESERSIIVREFNDRYPFDLTLTWLMSIRKALFKGNRLETFNRPLGRPEGINNINQKELQSFYDKYYIPANMSVVIAGGFSEETIIKSFTKSSFGREKKGSRNQIPNPFQNFINPTYEEQSLLVKVSDFMTAKVDRASYEATWAFPVSFPRKDRIVISAMLKELLNEEIREKHHLAYETGVLYDRYHNVGEYKITASIEPHAVNEIDKMVRNCINMLSGSLDLFTNKFQAIKASYFMDDLSVTNIVDDALGDLQTYQRIITFEEDYALFDTVSFSNIAEMISLLSKERQHTFITMP